MGGRDIKAGVYGREREKDRVNGKDSVERR